MDDQKEGQVTGCHFSKHFQEWAGVTLCPSAESLGLVLGAFLGQDDCWTPTRSRHASVVFPKNGQSSHWHSLSLFLPIHCNHLPSWAHCKIHQGLGSQPALSSTLHWLQHSQILGHWAPQRGFQLSLDYGLILETAFQMILLFPLTSKGLFSRWWARVQMSFIQEIEQLHPLQGPPKHCTVIKSPTRSAWAKILSLCPENHKHLSPLLSKEKSVVTVNTVNVKTTHRGQGGSLSPK